MNTDHACIFYNKKKQNIFIIIIRITTVTQLYIFINCINKIKVKS